MKKIALLTALVAAAFLCGCKAHDSATSALDVIMSRQRIPLRRTNGSLNTSIGSSGRHLLRHIEKGGPVGASLFGILSG